VYTAQPCEALKTMKTNCMRRGARRQNGFTLMELLIVMAIITILMLLAIPNFQKIMKSSHELSARKSLQTIQSAQLMYADRFPTSGFACNMAVLGGDPSAGPPTATAAQLIPQDLAGGDHSGYLFSINNCTHVTVNGTDRVTSYQMTAVPETVGHSGDLGYCVDANGMMKQDPAGGSNCSQNVQ
jgi:type IV pilus assembly protein PilA